MRSSLHWKDGADSMSQIEAMLIGLWPNPDARSTLKAKADIEFWENGRPFFLLCDVKLIQTAKGLAVKMPSIRQGARYHTLCQILSPQLLADIEHQLISAYTDLFPPQKTDFKTL